MYFRQILRTQFFWNRTACLTRLRRVYRAEVAALKVNRLVTLVNIFFPLTTAEHFDYCSTGPGGGCRKPAVSHHQEVWLNVPLLRCSAMFLCACWQQITPHNLCFPFVSSVSLTHRDHCAPVVMRWSWQRRLARSTATQLQPSSPKWSTKASLQTSFMKMRR